MPRDKRLWMTFPNDFWMHPKIRPLSDAAFRAFVEINGYSRMADLDGRVPVATAKAMWRPKALGELLANHPERPSLTVEPDPEGDVYVIWNYAEHQETRADREARSKTNTANGKRGGRPRKNRTETDSDTDSVSEPIPTENQSQSQESERDMTDRTYLPESSREGNARASRLDQLDDITIQKAQRVGIKDLATTYDRLSRVVSGPLSPNAAVELAWVIVDKAASQPVENVDAYVATACRNTPADVQKAYETCDLGVA